MHADFPARTAHLETSGGTVAYLPVDSAIAEAGGDSARLPVTVRILVEMYLRRGWLGHTDRRSVSAGISDLVAMATFPAARPCSVKFAPTRVLCQDHSGLPALLDLAAMRASLAGRGMPPQQIDPVVPIDLVVDHSVEVQVAGSPGALQANLEFEYARNAERYRFLRWAEQAFGTLRIVPPGRGIVHQVHLEHLARVVAVVPGRFGEPLACPDTVLGTDSHTPMINSLGVLGFGVGGIEAEAAMLGQPVALEVPEVVGIKVTGEVTPGVTATDLVLTLTEILRAECVVGSLLEFIGDEVDQLPIHDRATLANMCPEYGATCALFPVDQHTLHYLKTTGRDADTLDLVERYAKIQGLFQDSSTRHFTRVIDFDLSKVEPCMAGPDRPDRRIPLSRVPASFDSARLARKRTATTPSPSGLDDGAIVIAAITSCTNTSNPASMLAAGLLARNAVRRGLTTKPWVKASLAPGSRVVTRYLDSIGLLLYLEKLGFHLVGYGCTTCIGNSGPLLANAARAVSERDLSVVAVLSGNRNFEGRIHPSVRAAYLASPPLVVAWALAGTIRRDLSSEPIGHSTDGKPVMLAEVWPQPEEVERLLGHALDADLFADEYASIFEGDAQWRALSSAPGPLFEWDSNSTYIVPPPFLADEHRAPFKDLHGARMLMYLGDAVTTDHISPAGPIPADSPAGRYLLDHGVQPGALGSYGGRRGNHEVLLRGTFTNRRLHNRLALGRDGGWTAHLPDGELMTVHAATERYRAEGVPLIVVAGREYGMGSSRDWAAKGPRLLGVRAVLAASFERIHRSNLIGMGIVPLQFQSHQSAESLGLDGSEEFDIGGLASLQTRGQVRIKTRKHSGETVEFPVLARVESDRELDCLRSGGILPLALDRVLEQIRRSEGDDR